MSDAGGSPIVVPGGGPRSLADTVEIAEGVVMPRLGFGTYLASPGDVARGSVIAALELGYRSVDTASAYENEQSVGAAIRKSGIPREEVFVTTKVADADRGFDSTLAAFERSLARLGLDYVDLYLVHWPVPALARTTLHWPAPSLTRDTWRAMEALLGQGRARAIGVCNHLVHHLDELLGLADVPPAVNQVEFHPRLQQPDLQRFCAAQSIQLEAWAPIMRGGVFRIPEILDIAELHDKTAAQVTIRWILQKGIVTIPKSVHAERIAENADVFDFSLSAEEMAVLDSLDTGGRIDSHPDRHGWRTRLRASAAAFGGRAKHPTGQ